MLTLSLSFLVSLVLWMLLVGVWGLLVLGRFLVAEGDQLLCWVFVVFVTFCRGRTISNSGEHPFTEATEGRRLQGDNGSPRQSPNRPREPGKLRQRQRSRLATVQQLSNDCDQQRNRHRHLRRPYTLQRRERG